MAPTFNRNNPTSAGSSESTPTPDPSTPLAPIVNPSSDPSIPAPSAETRAPDTTPTTSSRHTSASPRTTSDTPPSDPSTPSPNASLPDVSTTTEPITTPSLQPSTIPSRETLFSESTGRRSAFSVPPDPHENTRLEPSFNSYYNNSPEDALLKMVRSIVYVRAEWPTDQLSRRRSDPLGLFQSQRDRIPPGYNAFFNNAEDSDGLLTVCSGNTVSGSTGNCGSCMCRTSRLNAPNQIYGTDSFVQTCIQGEVWGQARQQESPADEESDGDDAADSLLKANIFVGSAEHERVNFMTGSACTFHSEVVAIPFGAKALRVGLGIGWTTSANSSYFEEGAGKYVNFFVQKHHAGGIYQASSPVLEIQGDTEKGLVSLSTSAESKTLSPILAIGGIFIPPIYQKLKTYIHKKKRAELNLICNTITMRVGHFFEGKILDKLKEKQRRNEAQISYYQTRKPTLHWYLPDRLTTWASNWNGQRKINKKIKKRVRIAKAIAEKERKFDDGLRVPHFSLTGEEENSAIHLEVPWHDKKIAEFGSVAEGSTVALTGEEILLGGSKKGPDILIDHRNIKMTVGPKKGGGAPQFQQILIRLGVTLQTVASITEASASSKFDPGSRKSLLTPDSWTTCSKIEVKNRSLALTVHGNSGSGSPTSITLDRAGLVVKGGPMIKIKSQKTIVIEADGDINIKATMAKIAGEPILAK